MKWFKVLLIFSISTSLLLVLHKVTAVDRFVEKQKVVLCNWLNLSTKVKPKVGPLAFKRLQYLKSKYKSEFVCKVEESPHNYGYEDEKAIIIYHNNVNKLGLVYGFDYGGRNMFNARYYQLWTPKDSGEPEA